MENMANDGEVLSQPTSAEEIRNWADLPRDVVELLFRKLGAFLVIVAAQWVCRPWHEISRDSNAWRVVDLVRNVEVSKFRECKEKMEEVAMTAVSRSNGLMEEFYVCYIGDDHLLICIEEHRTDRLKCLSLLSCGDISDEAVIDLALKSPKLESVELNHSYFPEGLLYGLGQASPQLKHFKLSLLLPHFLYLHAISFQIAKYMQGLRHLHLCGVGLNEDALHAILDKCCDLESLHIRCYEDIYFDDSLRRKCARISDFRFSYERELLDVIFSLRDSNDIHAALLGMSSRN